MIENIDTVDRPRTGRPPTEVGDAEFKDLFARMEPHLHDWQHPGALAKRLELPHGLVATVLRRAAEDGMLHTVRTNPTSYRLSHVASSIPQPDVDDVDDMDEIPIDSLRWLNINLLAPTTIDELCNGTRARMDQVVEHIKAGIAAGYVFVSGDEIKTYALISAVPENISLGQVQVDTLRTRMKRHIKGVCTSSEIVASMGLTRERVRQLLDRAAERGIVERIEGRPLRFRMIEAGPKPADAELHPVFDQSVLHLPITTRAINVLTEAGVGTVRDLLPMTREQLSKLPGMGRKSVDEIVMALAEMGITPGLDQAA